MPMSRWWRRRKARGQQPTEHVHHAMHARVNGKDHGFADHIFIRTMSKDLEELREVQQHLDRQRRWLGIGIIAVTIGLLAQSVGLLCKIIGFILRVRGN